MPKLRSKFRILRNSFAKKLQRESTTTGMQSSTSPSHRRRLLGSIVLGRRRSSSDKCSNEPCFEDNKENNGTDQSYVISPNKKMDFDARSVSYKRRKSPSERSKDQRMILMTCSELEHHMSSGNNRACLPKSTMAANYNDLSPTSACSDMNYSSLADKNFIKVPSAKTISDRLWVPTSASSSDYASSTGMPLSTGDVANSSIHDKGKAKDRNAYANTKRYANDAAFYGKKGSLSPETIKIMREVERAYMTSPIPRSYISSPIKTAPPMPEINLRNAATLLAQQTAMKTSDNHVDNTKRNVMNTPPLNRSDEQVGSISTFSAPTKPANMHPPSSRQNRTPADGRSLTRSPVTVASGVSSSSSKPAALAVKREKQQRQQKMHDDKTINKCRNGRQNLDKRTARLRYGKHFKSDILQHRASSPHLNNGSNHSEKVGTQLQGRSSNGVSIAIRKRPIFDYELNRGDYDIVSIDNTTENSHDVCIVHNAVMHADMKQMLMKPTLYQVSVAFDEHCSDDLVYRHIAEPLVINATDEGISTIMMYGQTGCGKSHTMSGIEARAAVSLFHALQSVENSASHKQTITIQFVELCGSKECKVR
jgi:hypothetical protein